MKKLLLAILLLASAPAIASWHSVLQVSVGPPPSYTGPGDVVSGAFMWWGTRCYNNAYSGNVVDIVDTATGNTTGSRLQCSAGVVSALVSASACTFVTGNACSTVATTCAVSCNIRQYYDQSGQTKCNAGASACDISQATLAKQALYITSCGTNSKPCGQYLKASSQVYTAATNHVAVNQPFTVVGVASRTGSFTSFQVICCDATANVLYTSTTGQGSATVAGTAPTATASNSVLHSLIGVAPNTTGAGLGSFAVDGVVTTFTAANTTAWAAAALFLGAQATATNQLTGQILEAGVWPSAFSSTDITNMCHNQFVYWGTGVSC